MEIVNSVKLFIIFVKSFITDVEQGPTYVCWCKFPSITLTIEISISLYCLLEVFCVFAKEYLFSLK